MIKFAPVISKHVENTMIVFVFESQVLGGEISHISHAYHVFPVDKWNGSVICQIKEKEIYDNASVNIYNCAKIRHFQHKNLLFI